MGGRGSSGGGGTIPQAYGHKRISYAEYANGGYKPSEKISDSYDKETKTVEVRTYPRIEKAAEMIPESYIAEWAGKVYGNAKSKANRREAVFDIYSDFVSAAKEGWKMPSNAQKWEKDVYKYVKRIVKRYGHG